MRAYSTPLLAALLLACAVAPAAAAPTRARPAAAAPAAGLSPVTSDVRCLLTMVALANVNKANAQAAEFGVYFFGGRLSVRSPGLDLTAAVKAQAPTLGPPQLQAELKRCGPLVSAAGQGFESAINSLRPPGAPAPAAPAAKPAAPPAAASAAPPVTQTPK